MPVREGPATTGINTTDQVQRPHRVPLRLRHQINFKKGKESEMTTQGVPAHEGFVTVRGLASGFAQTVQTRSHRLVADEPLASGGTDTGPTPYDLLLAALGT